MLKSLRQVWDICPIEVLSLFNELLEAVDCQRPLEDSVASDVILKAEVIFILDEIHIFPIWLEKIAPKVIGDLLYGFEDGERPHQILDKICSESPFLEPDCGKEAIEDESIE